MTPREYFQINERKLVASYPGLTEKYFLEQVEQLNETVLEKLQSGYPLEYISEKRYFYNFEYRVTPDVLIPRYETEILVQESINYLKPGDKLCDVGCGSGNIFTSILLEVKDVSALAIDISEKALMVAQDNYSKSRCSNAIQFLINDRLFGIEEKFDLIVSNPPYIKKVADVNIVHKNVNKYEPHLALFLNDDEYIEWFKIFFEQINHCLNENGQFMMEGHENHLQELSLIANKSGFKCEVKKDLNQRDRFLKGSKRG